MYKSILIIACFVSSEACVTYNFQDGDFSKLFTNQRGLCRGQAMWTLGSYSDIDVSGQHELSTQFIFPNQELSCVASFTFQATARGTLEINVYMETSNTYDQMSIMANEVREDDDATVGHVMLGPGITANFVPGWHTLKLTLTGSGTYMGYITMLGIAAVDSVVLVDSFRYIPPNYEGECNIYEHEFTTTTDYTTSSETISTTPELTTMEEWTTTPEITTTKEWTTTPEITTTEEWTTTPEITTTEELTTTPEITTTEESTTTPEITTTEVSTPTSEITTTEESTTTPIITTTEESTTTPVITITEGSTTTQDITTTEESTTTTEGSTTTPQITTEESTMTSEITSTTFKELTSTTSDISTTLPSEDTDPTWNSNEPTQNTEITTEPTIPPTSRPVVPDSYSFWNPYTITMVVLLIVILLIIVAGVSYYFGMRKGRRKEPLIVPDFIDDLPRSIIIPRVDKIKNNSMFTHLD